MRHLYGLMLMVGAVFGGAIIFSAIRVLYYIIAGLQPNMAPQMFIVFSPVLATPIAVVAVFVHSVFKKFFAFNGGLAWILAGLSYSGILLGMISPWLLLAPALLNPITVSLWRRKQEQRKEKK